MLITPQAGNTEKSLQYSSKECCSSSAAIIPKLQLVSAGPYFDIH